MSIRDTRLGKIKLHPDFAVWEFACWCPEGEGCHGAVKADDNLTAVVQVLRDWCKRGITLTSAYRCDHRNAKKGGHPRSYHRLGMAADCTSAWIRRHLDEFAKMAAEILEARLGRGRGNVIIYRNHETPFVHVDVGRTIGDTIVREKD